MAESADILRLRTLLCFHNADSADCTVTNIARILGVEKYAVSRAVAALEKEGYIDKSNPRKPFLTQYGKEKAKYYADRVELSVNHLMYEGVDTDSAMKDDLHWALHNTDRSMDAIRAAEER